MNLIKYISRLNLRIAVLVHYLLFDVVFSLFTVHKITYQLGGENFAGKPGDNVSYLKIALSI